MKELACAAIDKHADEIVALSDSIKREPELGYKEFKTTAKIKEHLDKMGLIYTDGHAITGIVTPFKGRDHKANISVMGELDAVLVPTNEFADPVTGAAHCCGHNAQAASVVGVAYALKESGIMEYLDGDITLMHVPSEEFVELAFRKQLKDDGKITLFGGKQEFIRLGLMDDIDIMIMQHTDITENGDTPNKSKGNAGGADGKGFVGKLIRYTGKESHAANPHEGINALQAAKIGLIAIDANRETFRDEDGIRVHPIITKGGDLVNVIPADVRAETYVRGLSTKAIFDAAKKVDRSLMAGASAVGAECEITNIPGYMCTYEHEGLKDIAYDNLVHVLGEGNCERNGHGVSTDAADVSNIIPTVHMYLGGASGIIHGENYCITRPEIAVVDAAKVMVCTAIDLLADGAKKALNVKETFKAPMTKKQYLEEWCGL
jgi:amidohydrolase